MEPSWLQEINTGQNQGYKNVAYARIKGYNYVI